MKKLTQHEINALNLSNKASTVFILVALVCFILSFTFEPSSSISSYDVALESEVYNTLTTFRWFFLFGVFVAIFGIYGSNKKIANSEK